MKKRSKSNAFFLMALGMFTMASSSIIARYFAMTDFVNGGIIGIGIGLVLIALFLGDFKSKTTK